MKKLILAAGVLAVMVAGCGGGLKDKIVGSWKIDTATMSSPNLTDEMKKNPEVMAAMKKQFEPARIELKADGTATASGMGNNDPGKWTLNGTELTFEGKNEASSGKATGTVEADGSRIHLKITRNGKDDGAFDLIKA